LHINSKIEVVYKSNKKMHKEIKKVKAKYGTGEKLAKMFGLSRESISHALNGKTNTDKSKKIRQAAVKLGGDAIYN
jgi:transcriptional regulator with XRE-family HTH domain